MLTLYNNRPKQVIGSFTVQYKIQIDAEMTPK